MLIYENVCRSRFEHNLSGSELGWHSLPITITQELIGTLTVSYAQGLLSDWDDVMGKPKPNDIIEVNVRPAVRNVHSKKVMN